MPAPIAELAALRMVARLKGRRRRRLTLGVDKAYDTADFVRDCRQLGVTPHVAQHTSRRRSAIDGRTVTHVGYQLSQRVRKRAEEIYGWVKTIGRGRKLRFCGVRLNQLWAELTATAYNLVRTGSKCHIPRWSPAAMLDRLLHRSTVLHIDGESFRMRARRARVDNMRKGVVAGKRRDPEDHPE
jgi:hypothetical protein